MPEPTLVEQAAAYPSGLAAAVQREQPGCGIRRCGRDEAMT